MWHLTLLSVAWRGGAPPYVVQLSSADTSHRVLIEKEGVQAQRIRLPIPAGSCETGFCASPFATASARRLKPFSSSSRGALCLPQTGVEAIGSAG